MFTLPELNEQELLVGLLKFERLDQVLARVDPEQRSRLQQIISNYRDIVNPKPVLRPVSARNLTILMNGLIKEMEDHPEIMVVGCKETTFKGKKCTHKVHKDARCEAHHLLWKKMIKGGASNPFCAGVLKGDYPCGNYALNKEKFCRHHKPMMPEEEAQVVAELEFLLAQAQRLVRLYARLAKQGYKYDDHASTSSKVAASIEKTVTSVKNKTFCGNFIIAKDVCNGHARVLSNQVNVMEKVMDVVEQMNK